MLGLSVCKLIIKFMNVFSMLTVFGLKVSQSIIKISKWVGVDNCSLWLVVNSGT